MRPLTQTGPLAALFSIGMALAACQKTEAPPPVIRPVLSLVVQPGDAAAATYAGVVQARYQADLSFRVAGRVVARDVDLGEFVSRGQRLAALDPTSLEANLRSVEANRTAAEAQFTNADATLAARGGAARPAFDDASRPTTPPNRRRTRPWPRRNRPRPPSTKPPSSLATPPWSPTPTASSPR